MMEYKGYLGCSEVNEETGLIFGEVIGLRDVITYQGRTADEARESFKESIDLYLETCAAEGFDPDKPYSGHLLIRTKASVHRILVSLAKSRGVSLNTLTDRILTKVARKASISTCAVGNTKRGKVANTATRKIAAMTPPGRREKRKKV
jgi:predicted HicB family RNase H-like nuclease